MPTAARAIASPANKASSRVLKRRCASEAATVCAKGRKLSMGKLRSNRAWQGDPPATPLETQDFFWWRRRFRLRPAIISQLLTVAARTGNYCTVRLMVALLVCPSAMASTVMVWVPRIAVEMAVSFRMLAPAAGLLMVPGENCAVTPLGNPDAHSVTKEL